MATKWLSLSTPLATGYQSLTTVRSPELSQRCVASCQQANGNSNSNSNRSRGLCVCAQAALASALGHSPTWPGPMDWGPATARTRQLSRGALSSFVVGCARALFAIIKMTNFSSFVISMRALDWLFANTRNWLEQLPALLPSLSLAMTPAAEISA